MSCIVLMFAIVGFIALFTVHCSIGKETARALMLRGARVVLAVRNVDEGLRVVDECLEAGGKGSGEVIPLDLADFGSVKACAEKFNAKDIPIHILVLNAGTVAAAFCVFRWYPVHVFLNSNQSSRLTDVRIVGGGCAQCAVCLLPGIMAVKDRTLDACGYESQVGWLLFACLLYPLFLYLISCLALCPTSRVLSFFLVLFPFLAFC